MANIQENQNTTVKTRLAAPKQESFEPKALIKAQVPENKSRSKLESSLHGGDVNLKITDEVRSKVKTSREMLLNQPIKSANSIFGSIMNNVKNFAGSLDSDNPNTLRFKKYGSLALAAGFGLFAVKSSFRFISSLFSKDGSNKLVKFADAAVKWVMTAGLGGVAMGGNFKFNKGGAIIGGGLVSLLLSQLSNFNSGQQNALGQVAKLTGTDQLLNSTLNNAGLVPTNSDNLREKV